MAVWTPTYGEIVDEAAERGGLDPSALTHAHLSSIQRSARLALIDLESEFPDRVGMITTETYTLPAGTRGVALADSTVDVLDVSVRISNRDYGLTRISRRDDVYISDKTQSSDRPLSYWLSRSDPSETANVAVAGDVAVTTDTPVLMLWPKASTAATLLITRLRMASDPSDLGTALDVARTWFDAYAYNLAQRIAEKYNPERAAGLMQKYMLAVRTAKTGDTDRGPVTIAFRGYGFSRRRRH